MKKIIAMMLAAIMMLSLAACGDKTPDNPDDEKKTLIVGTSADYAPYEFMYPDANGNMVYGGIDISVAAYVAEHMGLEMQVENIGFDFLLTDMAKGDCDIVIAAMEVDDERLLTADFSNPYYTDLPAMIVVKAENADQYKTLADFAGKSVGAENRRHEPGRHERAVALAGYGRRREYRRKYHLLLLFRRRHGLGRNNAASGFVGLCVQLLEPLFAFLVGHGIGPPSKVGTRGAVPGGVALDARRSVGHLQLAVGSGDHGLRLVAA